MEHSYLDVKHNIYIPSNITINDTSISQGIQTIEFIKLFFSYNDAFYKFKINYNDRKIEFVDIEQSKVSLFLSKYTNI